MKIRLVDESDVETLWLAVYYASHSDEEPGVAPGHIRSDRDLAPFVERWGRTGDVGVVAVDESGQPAGAAWLRVMDSSPAAVDTAGDAAAELVIAVFPEYRGRGVGEDLLRRLLKVAKDHHSLVVLSARVGNPAVRLYERHGFETTTEITNRIGTRSVVMRRPL